MEPTPFLFSIRLLKDNPEGPEKFGILSVSLMLSLNCRLLYFCYWNRLGYEASAPMMMHCERSRGKAGTLGILGRFIWSQRRENLESSCIMDKISRWFIVQSGVIAIEIIMENVNLNRGLTSSSALVERIIELAYNKSSLYY